MTLKSVTSNSVGVWYRCSLRTAHRSWFIICNGPGVSPRTFIKREEKAYSGKAILGINNFKQGEREVRKYVYLHNILMDLPGLLSQACAHEQTQHYAITQLARTLYCAIINTNAVVYAIAFPLKARACKNVHVWSCTTTQHSRTCEVEIRI